MSDPSSSLYPEHARQHEVLEEAQAIGRFLDESGYILAEYREIEGYREQQLMPLATPIPQILAQYFGIDLAKLDAEKRAMISAVAKANTASS